MKKITICTMLLILSATSFSQQVKSLQSLTPEQYLTKNIKQRTTATILLISGAALAASQIIILAPGTASLETYGTHIALAATGVAAAVWGIVLFHKSAKNKAKAMSMSAYINSERSRIIGQQNIKLVRYPAVALRLNL